MQLPAITRVSPELNEKRMELMNAINARLTVAVPDTTHAPNQASSTQGIASAQEAPIGDIALVLLEYQRLMTKEAKQDKQMQRQEQAQQEHAGANKVSEVAWHNWKSLKLW